MPKSGGERTRPDAVRPVQLACGNSRLPQHSLPCRNRPGEGAGFRPEDLAGHSLRAGFLTSGAENGASVFKLMEVSRHKSLDMLRGYIRRGSLFVDNAVGKVGL